MLQDVKNNIGDTKMENIIEQENYKGCEIKIVYDTDPLNPIEEYDSFGKMICFHKRYILGHKHGHSIESFQAFLKANEKDIVVLPLYLYDHSGITISTTPFNCQWDSGQVGFIYATKEQILKEYGVKRITSKIREKVEKLLITEVDTYDKYLTGEVYGFVIEKNGEIEDSCYGFYDTPENLIKECKSIIDTYDEQLVLAI